mmetsp:Transcript_12898/g.28740  ORF Transcript_12898/g.28740 Transcript_12898/m.28740 type:complete len:210 (+) Transcript_12898:559-1188(+)
MRQVVPEPIRVRKGNHPSIVAWPIEARHGLASGRHEHVARVASEPNPLHALHSTVRHLTSKVGALTVAFMIAPPGRVTHDVHHRGKTCEPLAHGIRSHLPVGLGPKHHASAPAGQEGHRAVESSSDADVLRITHRAAAAAAFVLEGLCRDVPPRHGLTHSAQEPNLLIQRKALQEVSHACGSIQGRVKVGVGVSVARGLSLDDHCCTGD